MDISCQEGICSALVGGFGMNHSIGCLIYYLQLLAVVGDQLNLADEICGLVLSCREYQDIISIWTKTGDDVYTREHVRETIKTALQLPASTLMEYKTHDASLKDTTRPPPANINTAPLPSTTT